MRTYKGAKGELSCIHTDLWCQCTDTHMLTYRDRVRENWFNPKAFDEMMERHDRDRETNRAAATRDPADPHTGA